MPIFHWQCFTGSDCTLGGYNSIIFLCEVILFKAVELNLSTLNAIRTLGVYKHGTVTLLQHVMEDILTFPFSQK